MFAVILGTFIELPFGVVKSGALFFFSAFTEKLITR